MALLCCDEQWRFAIVRGLISVGTNFHQMSNDINMAVLCCDVQWRCAIVRGLIFVGTNFHQMYERHQDGRSVLRCTMALRHRSWLDLCGHQLPPDDERRQYGRSCAAMNNGVGPSFVA